MTKTILAAAFALLAGCSSVAVDITVAPDASVAKDLLANVAALRFEVSGAETAQGTRALAHPFAQGNERIIYNSSATSGELAVAVTGFDSGGSPLVSGAASVKLKPPFVHLSIPLAAGAAGTTLFSDASMHDFGDLVVGATARFGLTITNRGSDASGVVSTMLIGDGFSLGDDACAGQALPPGGSCTLSVSFAPAAAGPAAATLTVGADPGGELPITFRGNGVAPGVLSFSIGSKDFGTVEAGSASTAQTLTLANTGGQPSGMITTHLSGDTGEFTVVSDGCNGQVLAGGATCMMMLEFAPTTFGARVLSIEADAAPGGPSAISLGGLGRETYTLTVSSTGNGSGTISAPGLTCAGATCTGSYARTTTAPSVTITATPATGSTLAWSGACGGQTGPCMLTMDASKSATATFTLLRFAVGVTTQFIYGATGTVTSNVGGINCGANCSATVDYDTMVTLTAAPTGSALFQSWRGDCTGTQTTCTVAATQARNVTAIFRPKLNYMFVTSTAQPAGSFGSLAGADALCNARASAAGLGGTYVALLSTSTVNAPARLGSARGWIRTDGRPFADTVTSMFSTPEVIWNVPSVDETGVESARGATLVITGTDNNGVAAAATCSDWTTTSGYGQAGYANAGSLSWHNMGQTNCNSTFTRLYCFETDYSTAVTPVAATGFYAFVTKGTFDPSKGLATADALCTSEAATYNRPGAYKAMLATTTASAASRFTPGFNLVRPDGIVIIDNNSDFFAGKDLLAAINVVADGSYLPDGPVIATGAAANMPLNQPGTMASTCNNWTTNGGPMFAEGGLVPTWAFYTNYGLGCYPAPIICLTG